jgi:hypothetical protein
VLADTISNVATRVVTETSASGLEVNCFLDTSQVGASQIGRTTDELDNGAGDGLEDLFGERTRGDRWVANLVDGKFLFPTLGEFTSNATAEFSVLFGVLALVGTEEFFPLGFKGSTALNKLGISSLGLIRNGKVGLRIEAKLGLDVGSIIGLERSTVNTVSALELRSVADGGAELDEGGLVLGLLCLCNRIVDGSEVTETEK